jgi:hypothetical protein
VSNTSDGDSIDVHIGHTELIIRQRYEVVSIVNDLLIGVWFVIGSLLFFHESTVTAGTWLFVAGSCELLIRPGIRLVRRIHIGRITGVTPVTPETGQDF